MKSSLYFLMLTLFASCAENTDPLVIENLVFGKGDALGTDYFAFGEIDKDEIYFEGFGQNTLGWPEGEESGKYKASFEFGKYVLNNRTNNKVYSFFYDFSFDQSKDFEVEVFLKMPELNILDKQGAGIFIGNEEQKLYFIIDKVEQYFIGIVTQKTGETPSYETLRNWTHSNALAPSSDWNLFTIRKLGDTFYFFINKTSIGYSTQSRELGNKIGFFLQSSTRLEVDWLKLYYLQK